MRKTDRHFLIIQEFLRDKNLYRSQFVSIDICINFFTPNKLFRFTGPSGLNFNAINLKFLPFGIFIDFKFYNTLWYCMLRQTVSDKALLIHNSIFLDVGKSDFFFRRPVRMAGHAMEITIIVIIIKTLMTHNFSIISWEVAGHRRRRWRC